MSNIENTTFDTPIDPTSRFKTIRILVRNDEQQEHDGSSQGMMAAAAYPDPNYLTLLRVFAGRRDDASQTFDYRL